MTQHLWESCRDFVWFLGSAWVLAGIVSATLGCHENLKAGKAKLKGMDVIFKVGTQRRRLDFMENVDALDGLVLDLMKRDKFDDARAVMAWIRAAHQDEAIEAMAKREVNAFGDNFRRVR
jgi:hypothetical protein